MVEFFDDDDDDDENDDDDLCVYIYKYIDIYARMIDRHTLHA